MARDGVPGALGEGGSFSSCFCPTYDKGNIIMQYYTITHVTLNICIHMYTIYIDTI